MKQAESINFTSDAEFLAHAHALEQELTERYQEMADSMEVHNNLDAAKLFRQLADLGKSHAGELIQRAKGLELPQVPPWKYHWLRQDGPDSCMQDAHYLMAPSEALQLALRIERCAFDFYTHSVEGSSGKSVIGLAAEMLTGKQRHLEILRGWLDKELELHPGTPEDLDPPHIPE